MLIAALLTTAKTQKQLNRPSTDVWIKKMWCVYTHTHTGTSCSHKMEETPPFAMAWMDLEGIMLSEIS